MTKIMPLVLALIGLLAGGAAGLALKPAPETVEHAASNAAEDHVEEAQNHAEKTGATEFVKLNNQFVVPVVENGRVSALVVLSLSLEVSAGERANVYQMEPKLRDRFLRVMFDHANAGGFHGTFTSSTNMSTLRIALLEAAHAVMTDAIRDVLIIDIVRQDT